MASGEVDEELVCVCQKFIKLSSAGNAPTGEDAFHMNSKACGKMVKDCLPKPVQTIADASIFPKYKVKGKQFLDVRVNGVAFLRGCAHEYAKQKLKNTKLPADDPAVDKIYEEFKQEIISKSPDVKEVKISKTGGVATLTDTSKYTGAHKERFDETGKGKGIDGREVRHDNSGYVGQYKGSGSFGKK